MASTLQEATPTAGAGRRLRGRLLERSGVSGVELVVAAVLLAAVGFAAWGSHVWNGGFYWADDWYHARLYLFPDATGFLSNRNPHTGDFRPVLGILLAVPFKVWGLRTGLHLALAIALAAGASLSFYWLLRTLGMEALHAGVIAALVLLFPWSDSSRLWTTASLNNASLIFFFSGLVVALHGLRAHGRRAALLAAASVALYVLAVLTYEVVGGAALLSVAVYAWWSGWRPALRRWALDLVCVVPALLYVWLNQPDYHTAKPSLREQLGHGRLIVQDAFDLLWRAAVPAAVPGLAVALGLGAIVAGALVAWRRLAPGEPARVALARWLLTAGVAVLFIGVSYTAFLPGLVKYVPSAPGVLNRVNLLAAFGFATLVYALAMMAGTLLVRAAGRPPAAAAAVAALASLAIGAGYVHRDAQDKRHWARGWDLERRTLDTVSRLAPHPPRDAVVYTFGVPNYVAPGVPVFALAGDFRNAVKVELRNPHVSGYPMRPSTRWSCGARGMHPQDYFFGRAQGTPYGRGVFVSVPQQRAVVIRSRAQCLQWSTRFGNPPLIMRR